MKVVKVLGSGCKNCIATEQVIKEVAEKNGIEVNIEKVTAPQDIMQYRVMKTPAVVIDETLVHKGSVPDAATVTTWLTA
ncbi:thioredoxin family protein [Alteromonas sp. 14N.309.X.WAT.G.H12]|uniref:thioredoxin family protein n=1 Tax=Alteromonas sp. 14N.309.X.WAT.G.H12 TaxID=3120824 RepID=UPI002FD0CBAB